MHAVDENALDDILPASVKALLDEGESVQTEPEKPTEEKIRSMTAMLVAKRSTFVKGRLESGIENIWRKAEDNYACVDEYTGETAGIMRPRFSKPTTKEGPVTRETINESPIYSSAFERLTARYVETGVAKVNGVLFSRNQQMFTIDATPDPELVKSQDEVKQLVMNGVPLQRDPKPEEMAPPNPADPLTPPAIDPAKPPSSMPGVPLTAKDLVDEKKQQAHTKAKAAEVIIQDWMVEGKFRTHMRSVVRWSAKIGTGVLKGPFPEMRRGKSVTKVEQGGKTALAFQVVEALKPGFRSVSPWDFFPDPECGDNIQHGSGTFERDHLSEKQLKDLKELPGYFKGEIDQVITEGPGKRNQDSPNPNVTEQDTRYEVWYFTGWLTRDDVRAVNQYMNLPTEHRALKLDEKPESLSVVATLVNDCLIRCTMNALEKSGHYPYRVMPWVVREGCVWGIGVAEQVFMPQDMVNSATRGMVNNAGVSSGSQIVFVRDLVQPADGKPMIYGDKLWTLKPDASIDDVKKVFNIFTIPNVTPQMLTIITHAYHVAENSSNIPLISQGQSGKTTPDTLGGMQLQDNNANQLLLDVAETIDVNVIELVAEDLYEWNMLDPDSDESTKGDFKIQAYGSRAQMQKTIQAQFLAQQGAIVKDPAFGCNPKKWYAQVLESQNLTPSDIQYSKEEQAQLAKAPPPKAPQVQAAEIRAQVDLQRAKLDTDRDAVYVQAETEQTKVEHDAKMQELQLKRELAMLDYANQHQISIEELKTKLAETTMKLTVQKELAAQDHAAEVLKPPTEPAGQAPAGKSWAQ